MTISTFVSLVSPFCKVIELQGANEQDNELSDHFLYVLNISTESANCVFLDMTTETVAPCKAVLFFVKASGAHTTLIGPIDL